jgi:hypothetical protein
MRVRQGMRRALLVIGALAILVGCGVQDPYPLPAGPPGAATFHPVAVGETVTEAVLFIEARQGTSVEIVSAEAVGSLEGADVAFFASTLSEDDEGEVVIGDEREELAGTRVEDHVDPAAEPPADTVAVVAEITPSDPGRYVLSGVRLTYRINGAPERDGEGIDVVVTVCADETAPTECDDDPG